MQLMEQDEEAILLTQSGHQSIEEDLNRLVTVDRHEIANRIRDAKDYGDLTENAEYEAAKNAQAFVEGRILELKNVLSRARILNEAEVPTDYIGLGSTITVKDLEYGEDWTVTMVSPYEADPDKDRISDISPIGKALLKRKVGDSVEVKTPGGVTSYQIISISK